MSPAYISINVDDLRRNVLFILRIVKYDTRTKWIPTSDDLVFALGTVPYQGMYVPGL